MCILSCVGGGGGGGCWKDTEFTVQFDLWETQCLRLFVEGHLSSASYSFNNFTVFCMIILSSSTTHHQIHDLRITKFFLPFSQERVINVMLLFDRPLTCCVGSFVFLLYINWEERSGDHHLLRGSSSGDHERLYKTLVCPLAVEVISGWLTLSQATDTAKNISHKLFSNLIL